MWVLGLAGHHRLKPKRKRKQKLRHHLGGLYGYYETRHRFHAWMDGRGVTTHTHMYVQGGQNIYKYMFSLFYLLLCVLFYHGTVMIN